MKSLTNNWYKYIGGSHALYFSMVLFFILDTINFAIHQNVGLTSISSVSVYGKAIVEVIAIVSIVLSRQFTKELIAIGCFVILPIVSYLIKRDVEDVVKGEVVFIIKESNKYIFASLLLLWMTVVKINIKSLQKIYLGILMLSAFIVVGSLLIDLELFYTYGSNRFGIKPPLSTHNEITLFWIIGIVYLSLLYFNTHSIFNLIILVVTIFAASLLGTKAILLFISFYGIFVLVEKIKFSRTKKIIGILGVIIAIAIFFYLTGGLHFLYKTYEENGFLYSITSFRNVLFINKVLPILHEWKILNYLMGGGGVERLLVEMDVVDLFIYSGVLGVILYSLILRKTLFNFPLKNHTGLFLISQFLLIGSLAGHFFASGINAIYFAFLCYTLQNENEYK